MASCLLNCELVDIQQKLYRMTWWATALNQISVPGNMTMSGGSVAIITDTAGVKRYVYNETRNEWKLCSGVGEVEAKIPAIEYGYYQCPSIPTGGYLDYSIVFSKQFAGVPQVMLTPYLDPQSNSTENTKVSFGVNNLAKDRFGGKVINGASIARSPGFYWFAIYRPA